MDIGFVIYSATGNTRGVAQKLAKELEAKGHTIDYLEITPVGDPKQTINLSFEKMHDLSAYDMLVFGSFIEAFSLNPCMKAYLRKMDSFEGKKAAMLTTQQFPKKWLGGYQALSRMKKLLQAKGIEVLGGEDVNWAKEEGRSERIDAAVHKMCEII